MPHLNAPSYLTSYLDRAIELEHRDEYEAALAVYRRALELYPDLAILHNNVGCCLANLERYPDAEQEFLRAIQLTPVNRQSEIEIPDSYPKEPEQNLCAVRVRLKGNRRLLPARATHRSFRFLMYIGLFVTSSPLGRMLTLMSAVILIFLAITHSSIY